VNCSRAGSTSDWAEMQNEEVLIEQKKEATTKI
jgi:hypothetical protein